MSKIIGLVFILAGALLLSLGIAPIYSLVSERVTLPVLDKLYFSIAGAVLVVIGIVFMKFSSGGSVKVGKEVPIYYKNKNKVIGYRRMK
jgi:hypothetical protein